jgi:hypothetical protein
VGELRNVLGAVLPKEAFLDTPSISSGGRTFSLTHSATRGEEVLGVNLDGFQSWPAERKRCDALFACVLPSRDHVILTLVELKGGHIERAMEQIKATSQVLCKRPSDSFEVHSPTLCTRLRKLGLIGHRGLILGIIVAKRGLPLAQREKASLRKHHRIVLRISSGGRVELACGELAAWLELK